MSAMATFSTIRLPSSESGWPAMTDGFHRGWPWRSVSFRRRLMAPVLPMNAKREDARTAGSRL